MIGLQGKTLRTDEADFLVKNNIGGVILFERNFESAQQLHKLCAEIQTLRQRTPDRAPFFIAIDMEGGRVARLKEPFTQWPSMKKLGELDSTVVAFKMANALGSELQAVGVNVDFAPCVDVLTNAKNEVIGDRALSENPEEVARLGSALVRGFIKSGVIPCAKHFPGHGNTTIDSHLELPVDDSTLDQLLARELIPFKKVFRARLDMVMTAHMKFPSIDPDWPVTFSSKFLEDVLRKELRFRHLIISDDLDMKALTNHYEVPEIPLHALRGGCNVLLYCNEPMSPLIALDSVRKALSDGTLEKSLVENSHAKILEIKKSKLSNSDPLPFAKVSPVIGQGDHLELAKNIAAGIVPEDAEA